MTKSLNIILFGETGVGKSSLVNLIAGKDIAQTSEDSDACTMTYKPYNFSVHEMSYTIWDTRGFDEADTEMNGKGYLAAVGQAFKLIQGLNTAGGVDLLVLCHREGRITTTTRQNYRLFYEVLCESKVPTAIAITFLERHARMEEWWEQNVAVFAKHEIKVATHACITGLPGHPKSQESKLAIEQMLGRHDENGRYNMPRDQWFQRYLQRWAGFHGCPIGLKKKELEDYLRKRCEFSVHDAHHIACILVKEDDSVPQRRKRFLLF